MKRAPRSRQRHDLYAKYHDQDSEINDLLGECGAEIVSLGLEQRDHAGPEPGPERQQSAGTPESRR